MFHRKNLTFDFENLKNFDLDKNYFQNYCYKNLCHNIDLDNDFDSLRDFVVEACLTRHLTKLDFVVEACSTRHLTKLDCVVEACLTRHLTKLDSVVARLTRHLIKKQDVIKTFELVEINYSGQILCGVF